MSRKKRYRVIEYRKKHGITQEELAGHINSTQRSISRFETGKSMLRKDKLELLAFELGVTISQLLEER